MFSSLKPEAGILTSFCISDSIPKWLFSDIWNN